MNKIGRLIRVELREVWKREASDFTQWLQQNIEVLGSALDINLVNVEREQAAGSFSIDLVAEDEGGGTIIIENQLGKSDHDHLGKLITYLTAMEAKAAIWVVSDPRPEHVAAITWLNESLSARFYMVKVEAVRIENSLAAALFTLIVGPSDEAQEVGVVKRNIAERYGIRKRWWTQLIAQSSVKSRLHAHITPGEYSWIGAGSGVRGLSYNYVCTKSECGAELYIDRGKDADDENKRIFDKLEANRLEIEQRFGSTLSWQRLESRRASRVRYDNSNGGYRNDESEWAALQQDLIEKMLRLEEALKPYLAKLKDDL
jgi:hypothetical protein